MAESKTTVKVSAIEVEMGMSAQTKGGSWVKPVVRMNLTIDGGTNVDQRRAIIKQAFEETCENIEKLLQEL